MAKKLEKPLFERLINLVQQVTRLLKALRYCFLAAVALWLSITFWAFPQDWPTPREPEVPVETVSYECSSSVQKVLGLSDYEAANALFFEAHPERHGALIRMEEPESLKNDWWQYHDQVIHCKGKQQSSS